MNVVPVIDVIALGENPSQLVQRGAVVHSSVALRVRLIGTAKEICQSTDSSENLQTSGSGKVLKCGGASWSQRPNNVCAL